MAALISVLPHVLKSEGGFVNHPNDRGGATNMGITLRTFERYLGRPASINELKNIDDKQVMDIYEKRYFKPMGLDGIKSQKVAASR